MVIYHKNYTVWPLTGELLSNYDTYVFFTTTPLMAGHDGRVLIISNQPAE